MLTTPLCDLLEIDHPIVQGPMGPWNSVDLAAAVSGAGGLGLVGTTMHSAFALREDVALLRELTDAPFAVDLTEAEVETDGALLTAALDVRPKAVALGPEQFPSLAARARAAGVVVLHHATSARHAVLAAEAGAGVIVCPPALVAQVSDAVAPVPVVAAGGIRDGRELRGALLLGAQGVVVGRRFLDAPETGLPDAPAESAAAIVRDLVEGAQRALYPALRT
jgi:NAD(P)H-dependent flavin oxidoreductase YrpB (nitropropane dioxygenase family)